ncbi:MAG: cell division protein ZapA [Sphingomonadaceae bacterium]
MADVELSIGGRAYKLACRDGEEAELRAAASLLDSRVTALMQAHGAIAEPRLLLMAALIVAGELLERKASDARATLRPVGPREPAPRSDAAVLDFAAERKAIEALAARAERLAERLEEAAGSA